MKVRLQNLSPLPRTTWVPVVVPGETDFRSYRSDTGVDSIAVKGEAVGQGYVYRIKATLEGGEVQDGKLMPLSDDHAFTLHPWVTDDVAALIPEVWTKEEGDILGVSQLGAPELVSQSAAHRRYHVRGTLTTGFIFELWMEFLSGDPVINIWGALIWSDRNDPNADKWLEGIAIESGEYIALDFAKRNGFHQPQRVDSKWRITLPGPIGFIDGSGIPFRGRMLAAPNGQNQDPKNHDWANLLAAADGPVYGLALEGWDGKWLGSLNVPRVDDRESWTPTTTAFRKHFFSTPGHIYGVRPVGIGKTPGQTGAQNDFGATAGSDAVIDHDPQYLHLAAHGIESDFFRGFMHYEDGAPLDLPMHPRWVTWSSSTHFDKNQSPDRLGKVGGFGTGRATGWQGYDDQHRSQNNLAAFYQLTGDPLAGLIIEHAMTTDKAAIHDRAPRAIGRLLLTWANYKAVGFEKAGDLIDDLVASVLDRWPGKHAFADVKILGHNTDPRLGVTDENGVDLPNWSAWEHGLAAIGLYAAWKQTADNELRQLVVDVCRTVTKHSIFYEALQITWANNIWYPLEASKLGIRIPDNLYSVGSTFINATSGFEGVDNWTLPAVLIFLELVGGGDEYAAAARVIADDRTGGKEATNVRSAEWWAAVRSVT